MTDQSKAIVVPGEKQITPLEKFKLFIKRDDVMERFIDLLGDRYARPYVNDVILAVASNAKLLECTHASIVTAAIQSASLSLSVNPVTQQAHIVPYGGVAKFIAGWKGLRDMAYATNQVRVLHVGELYEGEYLEIDRITGRAELKGGKLSNKVHSLFCTLILTNGFAKTFPRTLEEIHEHAKTYNPGGYNHKDGPWQSKKARTVRGMEKKTIIREMILAWVPLDPYKKQLLTSIDETDYKNLDVIEVEFNENPLSQRAAESEEADEDELLRDLGYDEPPVQVSRETIKQEIVTDPPVMTYETARTVVSKENMRYADMTAEARTHSAQYQRGIIGNKNTSAEAREEAQYRLSAIEAIERHEKEQA